VSDIDTAVVDSLKAFDPKRPIREADMRGTGVFSISRFDTLGNMRALGVRRLRQSLGGFHR
jgi:hypothetical protein